MNMVVGYEGGRNHRIGIIIVAAVTETTCRWQGPIWLLQYHGGRFKLSNKKKKKKITEGNDKNSEGLGFTDHVVVCRCPPRWWYGTAAFG